ELLVPPCHQDAGRASMGELDATAHMVPRLAAAIAAAQQSAEVPRCSRASTCGRPNLSLERGIYRRWHARLLPRGYERRLRRRPQNAESRSERAAFSHALER